MKNGWPIVPLGEILVLSCDRVIVDPTASYPFAGVYGFGGGLLARDPISGTNTTYKYFHRLHEDDIVISTPKAWEGAVARVTKEFGGRFVSPVFPTFRCKPGRACPRYLEWFFKRSVFWDQLRFIARGIGARRESVSSEAFLSILAPLPPIEEQRRIVARIEALAAKIAEARTLRDETRGGVGVLLGRAIAELFNRGQRDGWQPGLLGDYVTDDCYGTSEKTTDDNTGTPILRMGNIQDGELKTSDLKYLHIAPKERGKLILEPGDIVVNRTNSAELVGKCAVFNLDSEYGFASYLIRLRLDRNRADPRLVAAYINSPAGRSYMFNERKQMTGQANVNATKLKALPIALPPLAEQRRIVAYLDSLSAKTESLKSLQHQSAAELDALLPSILDCAFKGGL